MDYMIIMWYLFVALNSEVSHLHVMYKKAIDDKSEFVALIMTSVPLQRSIYIDTQHDKSYNGANILLLSKS